MVLCLFSVGLAEACLYVNKNQILSRNRPAQTAKPADGAAEPAPATADRTTASDAEANSKKAEIELITIVAFIDTNLLDGEAVG